MSTDLLVRDPIRTGTPKPPVTAPRTFRPDIQGLRAIAVLLVVLFHSGVTRLSGGFVGVDVFFVISGFLITQHLLRDVAAHGRIRFASFYASRARRLLPMACLVVILALGATWYLTSALDTHQMAVDAIWTSFFAMNVHLAINGVDYQANQDPSPLDHYWSLAVEEQFYLVWPALLAAIIFLAVKCGATRRTAIRVAGFGMLAVFAGSLTDSIIEVQSAATSAYFLAASRAWELALGGLIAVSAGWLSRRKILSSGFLALVGLLMIGYAAVVFGASVEFPGVWALVPTIGCALVIVSGLNRPNFVERGFLSWRTMQGLGRISYGWYLWHWPLLVVGAMVLGRDLTVSQGLQLSLLGLWLAICSYIAFETPLRTLPGIAKTSGRGLLLGAVCILLTLALASTAYWFTSSVRLPGAPATPITSAALIPSVVKAAPAEGGVPDNLDPTLEKADDDLPDLRAADGQSCHAGLLQTTLSSNGTGTCVAGGTEKGTKTVVLTGDSHAYQWLPAMEVIAKERNWRLINLTKSACPLYDFQLVSGQLKRDYKECYQWRTLALARINAEHPAMIITSAAIFSTKTADFTNDWNGGVTRTMAQLRATGAKLVELDDTPFPRKDIPKCLAAHLKQTEKCDLPRGLSNADPARRAGTTNLAKAAGATTINPFAWFCGAKECPVILGNTLVYRDNSHMTATWAAKLAPLLNQQIPAT